MLVSTFLLNTADFDLFRSQKFFTDFQHRPVSGSEVEITVTVTSDNLMCFYCAAQMIGHAKGLQLSNSLCSNIFRQHSAGVSWLFIWLKKGLPFLRGLSLFTHKS